MTTRKGTLHCWTVLALAISSMVGAVDLQAQPQQRAADESSLAAVKETVLKYDLFQSH
jgi:hypothetical protein